MGALSGYAIGCCVIIILIASAVLVGWFGNIWVLTRIMPSYAAMVPATAASLILLALCVLDQLRGGKSRFRIRLTLVAAVSLLVYDVIHSLHWWLDAQEALDAERDYGMSVATQFCLFLAVICLWPRARPARQGYPWVTILATVGLIAALVALVGYLLDASALYSVFVFSDMALHTAISYALLFSAILLARPQQGWIKDLLGPGRGSLLARSPGRCCFRCRCPTWRWCRRRPG